MGGGPTPFGMDPDELAAVEPPDNVTVRGLHAHIASGLDADALAGLAAQVLTWARPLRPEIVNLGGGMGVDYLSPGRRFDWPGYAGALGALAYPGERLRIEPGRAITAYCGWYVTDVLDVKRVHGEWFAVLRGGTHHLRTPVTKGHPQPFVILRDGTPAEVSSAEVTLVGQLCTPKDVLARRVRVDALGVGDRVAFAMAGAYAWNISHHDFLMHPRPAFHYVP
jgi:diaminopimelate decarboxylase